MQDDYFGRSRMILSDDYLGRSRIILSDDYFGRSRIIILSGVQDATCALRGVKMVRLFLPLVDAGRGVSIYSLWTG